MKITVLQADIVASYFCKKLKSNKQNELFVAFTVVAILIAKNI